MTEMTASFLKLLFEPTETICVSHNQYGYHSVLQSDLNGKIPMISPNDKVKQSTIKESDINLIAINPIMGFRRDENVTAFRSFMMEIDTGTLEEQKTYMENSKMPASACIFSGNKSLHYAIVLDEPLPSLTIWRFYNQWILNVLEKTDQQIQNPTRSIRFPGNRRHDGKKLIQAPVFIGTRISQETLFKWLDSYQDKKPLPKQERIPTDLIPGLPDVTKLPKDVMEHLGRGVTESRNATWFYIGCRLAELNFDMNFTVSFLEPYFQEEQSFGRREWLGCLKSAYKRIHGDSYV